MKSAVNVFPRRIHSTLKRTNDYIINYYSTACHGGFSLADLVDSPRKDGGVDHLGQVS